MRKLILDKGLHGSGSKPCPTLAEHTNTDPDPEPDIDIDSNPIPDITDITNHRA
jgi:hypothetical protein